MCCVCLQSRKPTIQVLKVAKSGGVVKREREERRAARDARIKDYFYGQRGDLLPSTLTVRSDQLQVYRIGAWVGGGRFQGFSP